MVVHFTIIPHVAFLLLKKKLWLEVEKGAYSLLTFKLS